MPSPHQFLAYVRVSTEEQAASGLSLESQEQRIRAFVVSKGGTLAQLHVDAGVSCTQLPPHKRPGLCALLRDVEHHPRGGVAVVVYRLDRLARNARELLNLAHELKAKGVGLASVCEAIDTSTPSGTAYMGLLGVFSQYEAELIGERTRIAMRSALSATTARLGGVAPLGFHTDDTGHYRPEPSEAATVRSLFAHFLVCRSFAETARRLNITGCRTRNGKPFSHTTVALVLRNAEVYAGSRIWGRTSRRNGPRDQEHWQIEEDCHEAIVERHTIRQVQALLDRRDARRNARRRSLQESQDSNR